jgi:hypothetical protein
MPHSKKIAPELPGASYEAEMSTLRNKLAGRPYAKDIHDMLPEYPKSHIRNVVNGRCSNPLVLAALKIVVRKLDSSTEKAQNRLRELTEELGNLEVAA